MLKELLSLRRQLGIQGIHQVFGPLKYRLASDSLVTAAGASVFCNGRFAMQPLF
jgi:hypothetical protein